MAINIDINQHKWDATKVWRVTHFTLRSINQGFPDQIRKRTWTRQNGVFSWNRTRIRGSFLLAGIFTERFNKWPRPRVQHLLIIFEKKRLNNLAAVTHSFPSTLLPLQIWWDDVDVVGFRKWDRIAFFPWRSSLDPSRLRYNVFRLPTVVCVFKSVRRLRLPHGLREFVPGSFQAQAQVFFTHRHFLIFFVIHK